MTPTLTQLEAPHSSVHPTPQLDQSPGSLPGHSGHTFRSPSHSGPDGITPPSDPPGCPSHQANRLPPGLMLPSTLPLLSRHTPLAAAAPLSLASTAVSLSLVPHPPPHPTPTPNASSCCSQPVATLVLSLLQEKHPASQCLGLCLTLGRHPVLETEEAPRTWGALSPVSREGASAHTRTVWVHKPTTPAHVHTCTSTHSPQTCTHTHANTHSHSSTATHYTPYTEVHTRVHL